MVQLEPNVEVVDLEEKGRARKRLRVLNLRQSKKGCFTCKARKVKCDETQPACLRCTRSKRVCEGYATEPANKFLHFVYGSKVSYRPEYPPRLTNLSPIISDKVWQTSDQGRLAALGCIFLANDPYSDEFGSNNSVWSQLVPQLSHTIPTVNSAAAAFGAVYEMRFLSHQNCLSENTAGLLYSAALRNLHQDLQDQVLGTWPLVITCVLLACSESLQRHPRNAHMHVRGGIKVWETKKMAASDGNPNSQTRSESDADIDLIHLLMSLDLQTSLYASSRPPDFHSTMVGQPLSPNSNFQSIREANIQLVQRLHSCLCFTCLAVRWKYMPPAAIPTEMSIEQGRHISSLTLWLKCFNERIPNWKTELKRPSNKSYRHALMLRTQCLAGLIHVSTILSPYEVEYDRHASSFQQIITDAEEILTLQQNDFSLTTSQFRPYLGIIQPLHLAALKYRHSQWRRRALKILQKAGTEGPWLGRVEYTVAQETIQAEEADFEIVDPDNDPPILPEQIGEHTRICGVNLVNEGAVFDEKPDLVRLSLSRCVDVETMISGSEHFMDAQHWIVWEIDARVPPMVGSHLRKDSCNACGSAVHDDHDTYSYGRRKQASAAYSSGWLHRPRLKARVMGETDDFIIGLLT